jgi:uncharacterized membrane protein
MFGRREVTRIEGFSDAVFGFALTLLVVSLEVPNNFGQLMGQMRGFIGFALMFAMVCWIWYEHNVYFRRFAIEDQWTVFLNSVLLFLVLFYVYPLKFLTLAVLSLAGLGVQDGPTFGSETDGLKLMVLYSSGVVLIFGIFVLLYLHVWRRRDQLAFDASSETALRFGMRSHALSMGIGVLSLCLLPIAPSWMAGVIYGLMGPVHAWNGYQAGKAQAALAVVVGPTPGGPGLPTPGGPGLQTRPDAAAAPSAAGSVPPAPEPDGRDPAGAV